MSYSVLDISISRMQNRYMHKRKEKIFDEFVFIFSPKRWLH